MSEATAPVIETATVMCFYRALEYEREVSDGDPEKLFSDSLAELLAGPASMKKYREMKPADQRIPDFIQTMHVRTRFFDDTIKENLGTSSQVVLLGAGLDARAYRLEGLKRDVTFYEVDKPQIAEYKNKILGNRTSKCVRVSVDADFSGTNWTENLLEAGFKKEIPTIWILEGLIFYLSETDADLLMKSVAEISATGSVFAFDVMNSGTADEDPWSAMMKFRCDNPEQFLSRYGWSECRMKLPSVLAHERGIQGRRTRVSLWRMIQRRNTGYHAQRRNSTQYIFQ